MEGQSPLVEVMVQRFVHALQSGPSFESEEGMSAVLTFAMRFAKTVLTLSPPESKEKNVESVCRAFKMIAAELEFEYECEKHVKVH